MPAQKSSVSSLFGAIFGTIGFSALAGVLATVMVAPAIAMTGITANNTIGIFESLPDYIELNAGHQQNEIVAIDTDGNQFHDRDDLRPEPRRGRARPDERLPQVGGHRR